MTRDRTLYTIRACAAVGLGVAVSCINPAFSQALSAHTFTDQQLESTGWTSTQIAEMRARAPAPKEAAPPKVEKDPELAIRYHSVFDDYVSFDYLPDIGWREANDKVGKIGGWRSYARLVQEEQKKEAMRSEEDNK